MSDLAGLDLSRLESWLRTQDIDAPAGSLSAVRLQGGRSNLTFRVSGLPQDVVVRRPPIGPTPSTAHDMSREFRVISALHASPVPVPRPVALCPDPDVLGTPFYLMEFVPGLVLRRRADVTAYDVERKAQLAADLVQTLADIHAVDVDAVGLAELGRPDGYLERQVARWRKHLSVWGSERHDELVALADRLSATMPSTARNALVHGDFRLDNLIVGPDLDVRAVVDWEMATLGDPLADVGLLVVYWDFLADADNALATSMGVPAGFPPGRELVRTYAELSGADLGRVDWYVAMAAFKLAVVLEGVRFRDDRDPSARPDASVAGLVPLLVRGAEEHLARTPG